MKSRKGFTLVELLLSLALISIIIAIGTNLLIFGTKSHGKAIDEFSIQASVRLISENVNNVIRDSSGVFLLDKVYPDSLVNKDEYFTEGWNYLMLNEENNRLVEWVWNGTNHIERVVINSLPNVKYYLTYDKEEAANVNRLLKYSLVIEVNGKERIIESELEGINTLQIIDRSYGGIANTLAYRSDSRLTDVGVAQAAVSFVVDKSGSMGENLGGKSRLNVLKEEATKMIEGLAEYDNINLSVTPFSGTANNETDDNHNKMMNLKSNKGKFITDTNSIFVKLKAQGNTNTGDGMRRGYHTIYNYNDQNKDKTIKNFMIILVDGETNRGTITEKINPKYTESGILIEKKDFVMINERKYVHSKTSGFIYITQEYTWNGASSTTYLNKDGNIDNTTEYSSVSDNIYYPTGRIMNGAAVGEAYVNDIGGLIKSYRNTRDDGIEIFIIGFSPDATPKGLQQIANATESKHGTNAGTYKYYRADTAEALEAVLNEIKFQISEALWHIGGPN